jgi:hypothetical protein
MDDVTATSPYTDQLWPSAPPSGPHQPAISPVSPNKTVERTVPPRLVPTGVLFLGAVGLHIAAMWPAYPDISATPIVSSPSETALYIGLEIGWALAAVLVLTQLSVEGGILFGAGVGAVELGYLISDVASSVQGYSGQTPGVWLALSGLGMGLAGVLFGAGTVALGRPRRGLPPERQPRAILMVTIAFLATAAFLPSWDRFTAVASATGQSASFTAGNAFSQGAATLAGDLVAAVALAGLPVVAAYWHPVKWGAWPTAGVMLALASQLASALVQVRTPISPALSAGLMHSFGVRPEQAQSLGVHFSISLTNWWTADVAAVVALAALVAWDVLASRRAPSARAGS